MVGPNGYGKSVVLSSSDQSLIVDSVATIRQMRCMHAAVPLQYPRKVADLDIGRAETNQVFREATLFLRGEIIDWVQEVAER